jgi:ABC-type glycerol-3-phosphate transport system substrate-binding protein
MNHRALSRRSFLRLSGIAVVGGALAACAPATPAQESSGEESAAGEMPAGIEGREFILWGLQYDPHVERYHMLADAFEEETGAVAIVEPQAWPLETKVIAAMAAGTVPDVTCIMGKQLVPLLEQGALVPMEEDVFAPAGINPDEFFNPGAIGAFFYDGQHWGIPVEDNNVGQAVGVRTDWIEEAGGDAMALWTEAQELGWFDSFESVWQLAEMLQQTDDGGNVTVWGMNSQGWDNRTWMGIMRDLGQHWWDPDNQEFFLNSEEAMEALRLYVDVPLFERGIETHLDMHHMNALLAGRVAIGVGNNAMAGEAAKIEVPVESVVRPPTTAGQEPLFVGEGGWGFEVPKQAENQELGIEFLRFMCTYEGQYLFAGIYGGTMPASVEVMQSDIYQGDNPVKRSVRRNVMMLANSVYYGWGFGLPSEMERITSTAITQVRTGELTIAESCDQMQVEMQQHHSQWLEAQA